MSSGYNCYKIVNYQLVYDCQTLRLLQDVLLYKKETSAYLINEMHSNVNPLSSK